MNGRPETAAFDAVLGLSLTTGGLGVTCTNAHGRSDLLPPVPRVGCAWCLGPSFQPESVRAVAAAGSLTRHHPLPPGGVREPKMAPRFQSRASLVFHKYRLLCPPTELSSLCSSLPTSLESVGLRSDHSRAKIISAVHTPCLRLIFVFIFFVSAALGSHALSTSCFVRR